MLLLGYTYILKIPEKLLLKLQPHFSFSPLSCQGKKEVHISDKMKFNFIALYNYYEVCHHSNDLDEHAL